MSKAKNLVGKKVTLLMVLFNHSQGLVGHTVARNVHAFGHVDTSIAFNLLNLQHRKNSRAYTVSSLTIVPTLR